MNCYLAQFSHNPCSGRLVKVHLISKQRLKRAKHDPWDDRAWVGACGGMSGLGGHHGELDGYKLQIPAWGLPTGLLDLCADLQLTWWLERRYKVNLDYASD